MMNNQQNAHIYVLLEMLTLAEYLKNQGVTPELRSLGESGIEYVHKRTEQLGYECYCNDGVWVVKRKELKND
jgi:hypothetical protein